MNDLEKIVYKKMLSLGLLGVSLSSIKDLINTIKQHETKQCDIPVLSPRFIVDERNGCIGIRDTKHPRFNESNGLNQDIPDVSNFVLLLKPNYKAKDGTIKQGVEINGKYYAPQNDC